MYNVLEILEKKNMFQYCLPSGDTRPLLSADGAASKGEEVAGRCELLLLLFWLMGLGVGRPE